MIEKEVKYQITNPIQLIEQLKKQKAVFRGYHLEKTIRIDNEAWTFSNAGTFIRLRTGFKNTLTLKKARMKNSEVSERLELEVEIDDIDVCRRIFEEIGLTDSLVMEKYRMMWEIDGTAITIDELPFGVYVEIEGPIPKIKLLSELLGFQFENRLILTYWEIYRDLMDLSGEEHYDPNILFPDGYVSKLILE